MCSTHLLNQYGYIDSKCEYLQSHPKIVTMFHDKNEIDIFLSNGRLNNKNRVLQLVAYLSELSYKEFCFYMSDSNKTIIHDILCMLYNQ